MVFKTTGKSSTPVSVVFMFRYHFDCFWGEAQTDISEATIRGFSWLKWEHQEEIRDRCKVIQGQNKKRKAGDAPGPSKQPKRAKGDSAKDRKKLEVTITIFVL